MQPTSAATRTWTGLGLTNNWSEAANWSGGVPGAGDIASFDGTSSKNAIMNAAVNVGGVSVAPSYGGTISQATGIAATVGATGWSQAGGAFVGGTAGFTVNGPFALTGGTFAATTGTLSVSGAFSDSSGTFAHNGGTVSLNGGAATIDVAGSETFNALRLTAGAKTIASGDTLNVGGLLTLTDGTLVGPGSLAAQGPISQASTYDGGTATLLINGTADQTFTGAGDGDRRDAPAGHRSTSRRARSPWPARSGPLAAGPTPPGPSTRAPRRSSSPAAQSRGSQTLNDVDVRVATTLAAGTTLTVGGSLTLTAGSINGTGTLAAQGPDQPGLDVRRRDGHPADQRRGRPDVHGHGNGDRRRASAGRHQQVRGHAHPRRHDPDHRQLDVHRRDDRPGGARLMVFAGGTISGNQTLNDVDLRATTTIAAGTTVTVAARSP